MEPELVFAFTSTSSAILAEQLLLQNTLPVTVMPLPSVIQAGCGIGLRLPPLFRKKAEQILITAALPYHLYWRKLQDNPPVYSPYEKEEEVLSKKEGIK